MELKEWARRNQHCYCTWPAQQVLCCCWRQVCRSARAKKKPADRPARVVAIFPLLAADGVSRSITEAVDTTLATDSVRIPNTDFLVGESLRAKVPDPRAALAEWRVPLDALSALATRPALRVERNLLARSRSEDQI